MCQKGSVEEQIDFFYFEIVKFYFRNTSCYFGEGDGRKAIHTSADGYITFVKGFQKVSIPVMTIHFTTVCLLENLGI